MKLKVRLRKQIEGCCAGQVVEVEKYVPKFYRTFVDPMAWQILPEFQFQVREYLTYQPDFVVGQNDFEILDCHS